MRYILVLFCSLIATDNPIYGATCYGDADCQDCRTCEYCNPTGQTQFCGLYSQKNLAQVQPRLRVKAKRLAK
jgi:hypothetical protein